MSKIYFVRHGETVWNVENKICGATDSPLTEKGHEQAVETAKNILALNVSADLILYSPLSRTKDTAMHISEILGVPAKEEPRLFEQNFGKYESTARDGKEFHEMKKGFVHRFGGGESMLQLAQRVYNLLDELKEQPGKTFILVAHNGIARVVQSYFYEMTNDEFASFGIKNCEVREYELTENEP
ncbi:MAG: histidine phosphatase family protein [Clostridiales bacterium]|nr:histidine phosphatase family protein [Clostridiales bacterium]